MINKKGGTALLLFRLEGNRQEATYIEKHKQSTPYGREPLSLVLIYKYFGGIYRDENKDLKSKFINKLWSRNAE